ncbi:MAG TPA: putative quinol monooxygenase [Acidobacteriaceae bacterium]|jgi:quinol monooxygenase YgiN|nr:putative quinol monooxygenase [Acidobacteriaceae bacterium]
MISFTVRMRFAPEDREQVSEALRQLTDATRQEPGCVTYIPHELADDPNTVVIYEQYRDKAALEAHRTSPHFHDHAIGGLYQWMRERSAEDLNALA